MGIVGFGTGPASKSATELRPGGRAAESFGSSTSQDNVVQPMSEKLGRLPSVGIWLVSTLLVAVLVICLIGSIIGLMLQPQ